jgi:hypothetical protein
MAEEPRNMVAQKIQECFDEVWCGKVEVVLEKGRIASIPAQTVQRPGKRGGVLTQHTIPEDIAR